jgi:hypothetical protein
MTTADQHTAESGARPPPRVIRVARPEGLTTSPTSVLIFGFIFLGCGCIALCLGAALQTWAVGIGAAVVLASVGVLAWWPGHRRRREKQRQEYLAKLRGRGEDPVAVEIAARWEGGGKGVSDEDTKTVLAQVATAEPPRAHIVCLGEIDVPEVGDLFFEPEIITPTRYIGYRLVFIPVAAALITLWLLQRTGVIPGRVISVGGFGYVLAMGIGAGVAWVWRGAIRPTYVRMAPGVVQIMEYRSRKAKPIIRSYPMDGPTLVILRGKATGENRKKHNLKLTLWRGEQSDKIELSRIRKREDVIEKTWQALLSTAPTPPLSDEELVG